MGSIWGNKIKISVFGESHGSAIGVVIDGLPSGILIDEDKINKMMSRRRASSAIYSTPRVEDDIPKIISGIYNGYTSGAPLCAVIENKNVRSGDYTEFFDKPRPGHADLTARIKYNGFNDPRGGGHFSGRLTACLVFAGAVCTQILALKGIEIGAHIYSIGEISDTPFDLEIDTAIINEIKTKSFPVINDMSGNEMIENIKQVAGMGDSIGGIVECAVIGLSAGIGEPMFESVESVISSMIFSIPAVKGIEFGQGFVMSRKQGSENNDEYMIENGEIKQTSNNCGGILGGISTGASIIFRAGFKPTASIFIKQNTVDLKSMNNCKLEVKGRHDSCIIPRAVVVVEACTAIAILNLLA